MVQKTSPFIEGKYGWSLGESGWNTGMDENLQKFSYLFDRNIDGIVGSLPPVVNGKAYFLTTDKRVYFGIDGTYSSSPVPKYFQLVDKVTGQFYEYDGTTLNEIDSNNELKAELDALNLELDSVQTTISSLGTAAFQPSTAFAPSTIQNLTDANLGSNLIGFKIANVAGAVGRTLYDKVKVVDVKDFGAVGNGVADDTASILAAIAYCFSNLPSTLYFPKGTYLYSSLGNLARTGFTMIGAGYKETVLKFTGTGRALLFDAFASGSPTDPFVQRCNVSGFTVEGNTNTTACIYVQGLARCKWNDIFVREANNASGNGFEFRGFMLSTFYNIGCSTDLQAMTNIPRTGIYLDEGRRAGVSVGQASNNTFISPYFEGTPIGGNLFRADQNLFLGGAFESNTVYGLIINTASRYNTLIGTGFESASSTADISDAGISTKYLGIYSSKSFVLQGRQLRVEGGFFERIELQSDAKHCEIVGVTIKHWNTGSGGFFDSGFATRYRAIYDSLAGVFVYIKSARASITVGASPFTYTNTSGVPETVILQGGTVSAISVGDGSGDLWTVAFTPPVTHYLRPGDLIRITYSVAPGLSRIRHNEN